MQPTQAAAKSVSYTVFDTCGLTPIERPKDLALACGDAGLQLTHIEYVTYRDKMAAGKATIFVKPTLGTDPSDVGRTQYPVKFTVDRVAVRRQQPVFTRLRLSFLNGEPSHVSNVFRIPMTGRYA